MLLAFLLYRLKGRCLLLKFDEPLERQLALADDLLFVFDEYWDVPAGTNVSERLLTLLILQCVDHVELKIYI